MKSVIHSRIALFSICGGDQVGEKNHPFEGEESLQIEGSVLKGDCFTVEL